MNRLEKVHPDLIAKFEKIRLALETLGFPVLVTQGFRTAEEQKKLWMKGRDSQGREVGPIVTRCDGFIKKSNHQAKADGWGHALDIAFLVDGKPSWDPKLPWKLYGEMAKSLGLKWGGDSFGKLVDRPHIELP